MATGCSLPGGEGRAWVGEWVSEYVWGEIGNWKYYFGGTPALTPALSPPGEGGTTTAVVHSLTIGRMSSIKE